MATIKVTQTTANAGKKSLAYQLAVISNRASKSLRSGMLASPGLRIVGGSASALAEAQTAIYAIAAGAIVTAAAGQDMPALSGTVAADEFGIYVWTIDSAGTIAQLTLATGATLAAITFPTVPADATVIGAVIVNPTGTGPFVGGTTVLDDGTVVPNAVFLNGSNFGALNPGADLITFRESGVPS